MARQRLESAYASPSGGVFESICSAGPGCDPKVRNSWMRSKITAKIRSGGLVIRHSTNHSNGKGIPKLILRDGGGPPNFGAAKITKRPAARQTQVFSRNRGSGIACHYWLLSFQHGWRRFTCRHCIDSRPPDAESKVESEISKKSQENSSRSCCRNFISVDPTLPFHYRVSIRSKSRRLFPPSIFQLSARNRSDIADGEDKHTTPEQTFP